MNVTDPFLETLHSVFGYRSFRSSQREVIEAVTSGQHAMIVAPTGSGKSLCYQIPALADKSAKNLVVVLSPLIALMKDQVDALQKRGVDAAYINSSLSAEERESRYLALRNGAFRLLYVTPERFRKPTFLDAISTRHCSLLAVDEAHCVSQWGHDFRPDYSRLDEIRGHLGEPTTLFLTATATSAVRDDILQQMQLSAQSVRLFHEGIDRPNLSLKVTKTWDDDEKIDKIIEVVDQWREQGAGIIYVTLIKTLERLQEQLRQRGYSFPGYHGQLPRNQRRSIQEQFLSGDEPVVLATNAFGMGIDKEDIRFVLHAETPGSIEAYYQEVGRAGRDGNPSVCHWYYSSEDLMTQMQFIDWRNPDADFFHRTYHFLTERGDEVRGFGLQWLSEQLQRVSRHDHRLETVIALLDRHGVVAGPQPPECFDVIKALPEALTDADRIEAKRLADQKRLYALVEFSETPEEDRQAFLRRYFGLSAEV